MFNNVLNYVLVYVLIAFGMIMAFQYFKIAKLEVNVVEQNNAIQAYEELIKVIPFNRVVEERNSNAEDEINATLGNVNAVIDGTYRL